MHINYGAENLGGFLAIPDGKGPFPALVVIHEWWGLNDQILAVTADFAAAGFASLAVDLYRGPATRSASEAQSRMMSLDRGRALSDIRAAFDYLAARPDVKKNRVGSIGWCMGGGFSLQLALTNPDLAAAVIYYGSLVTDPQELRKIHAPVIGFFGEDDAGIPPAAVRSFEEAMNRADRRVSVTIYPGAGHAFANPTRTEAYRPDATKDAWVKTIDFLNTTLG